jgi:hypothetical protein
MFVWFCFVCFDYDLPSACTKAIANNMSGLPRISISGGVTLGMCSYMGREIPRDNSGELTGELPDFPAGLYTIDKVVR